jgi:hypothetical protein
MPLVPILRETLATDFDTIMDGVIIGRLHISIMDDVTPIAVMMPHEDYDALLKTMKILGQPNGLDVLHEDVKGYRPPSVDDE